MLLRVEWKRIQKFADRPNSRDKGHEFPECIADDGHENDGDVDSLRLEIVDLLENGGENCQSNPCITLLAGSCLGRKLRHTQKESTKSPGAQRWIIIHVNNMSKNIFGIGKDSSLSKMIFLRSIEERRFIPEISDVWGPVECFLGIESRGRCYVFILGRYLVGIGPGKTRSLVKLTCHDEGKNRVRNTAQGREIISTGEQHPMLFTFESRHPL